ncbi:MAG: aminopeptidase [Planctomycetota bacterium]|nr:aminopeptidase [Planctomycetota bacterium]
MRNRRLLWTLLAGCGFALLFVPGCKVGYLLSSGYYQAELLALREPVDDLRGSGRVTPTQEAKLDVVQDAKTWGAGIGLEATDNYETVSLAWERQIWNVSACDPVSFEARRWWFPIVGSFPYLGFFREQDARELQAELEEEGYDVYVRTAGAYSTLGWFKDPILPGMLEWSDWSLAETVFHELAHATLWVPGSVKFNESFASFVGEVAVMRYWQERCGSHDPELLNQVQRAADMETWRALQHGLYEDLDAVYTDPELTDEQKLARKAEIFEQSFPATVRAATFYQPLRFEKALESATWNNARLIQFKTYNTSSELFRSVLERSDYDLLRFIQDVGRITSGRGDPFDALRAHLGPP